MKARLDVVSGFLGAGKTTLIKKLIADWDPGKRLVVLQNEHGTVGFSGAELTGTGVELEGISAGCICCDMTRNFIQSLETITDWLQPERILLEPSGIGRLSDILRILDQSCQKYVTVTGVATVVDATKFRLYLRNYRGFYDDQLQHAPLILLTHTGGRPAEEVAAIAGEIQVLSPEAKVVSTPLDDISLDDLETWMRRKECV